MENVEFHSVPFSPIKPFPFTLHWFPFSWDYHENHGIHVNSQYRFISDVFHVVLMHGSNVSTTTLHLVHSTGLVVRLQRHPVDDCWRLPSPWNFNASPQTTNWKDHTRARSHKHKQQVIAGQLATTMAKPLTSRSRALSRHSCKCRTVLRNV